MKGDIKGCRDQWADGLIIPYSAPLAGSTPARVGFGQTRWWLPPQTRVTDGSWADGVFPYDCNFIMLTFEVMFLYETGPTEWILMAWCFSHRWSIWGRTKPPLTLTHWGLVKPFGDRSGSTLTQVMACCLTAPSHYLNQCRLIISKV